MGGRETGTGGRDSVAVVRAFIADWKAGRAADRDLRSVAQDLETVRGRLERVRALHPECRIEMGGDVGVLLKLLGRQRTVSRPRLATGLRRAAAGLL